MRERGATLFLVTHEESLARRCERMVRLKDGRIVADDVAPHEPALRSPCALRGANCAAAFRAFASSFACLVLGVAAIAGVESLSATPFSPALHDQGRVLLGGDVSVNLVHRAADARGTRLPRTPGPRLRDRLDARHGLCAARTAAKPSASWSN